jgi:biopolymer transport protein ExbD
MQTLGSALKRTRRKNPISLTPLIDVVFILLVFFMLASSFQKTRTVELQPPVKGKSIAQPSEQTSIKVLVAGTDRYEIANKTYDLAHLETFLKSKTDQTVLIQTGQDAAIQDVVSLLDVSARLNLEKISLLPFEGENP